MHRFLVSLVGMLAVFTLGASAQVPAAQLAQPPAGAEEWVITSTSAIHGRSHRWATPDGVRHSRENLLLRGFATDIDQELSFGDDGGLISQIVRGSTPAGDAAELFRRSSVGFEYRSPVDNGGGAGAGYYASFGGTLDSTIGFTDALMRAPAHAMALLPSGQARIERLATLDVSNGVETKTLTAYAILGVGLSPFTVWYEGERFFGTAGFLSYIPVGWEGVAQQLNQAQDAALSARSAELAARIAPRLSMPVVFQGVRLYDSERQMFRDNMTVIVDNGRIASVAPAGETPPPAQAVVYQGAGRTLVPGLWDNHQHYGGDDTGPLLLSQGITSVRDPGNNPAVAPARRARIERGEILGTRIVPSMLIDGEGPNSAQVAVIVRNRAEAVAAVRRAKAEGYFGIKLYGSLNPAWVRPMAQEAHRLGLRVSGHIPQGMRTLDAVRAGYDEITHINWVIMQAMPESVIQTNNGLPRFYGPGRYGADVDLRSPAMSAYLDELQRRRIVVDPTLSTFEPLYVPDSGEMAAPYAPFTGTMPVQVERGFRGGGLSPTPEISRDQMRRSFAAMTALVGELHRRGITIVAGTDGTGLELVRELELYVQAGMTPAEALATATIIPAREFGAGDVSGAISVGRNAELFLVEGDPSRDIGDLRNVVAVMRDGRLMQASDLRAAVGISGPAHRPN
ncbi:MAG: amidohydrolase family protein [Terricaulis sp.]